jgi:D-glycero-D-manno-heptose 1,7-bisphosphate phosphatase
VSTGLTGESGDLLKTVTDYCFCVPSDETPRIQEAHIMTGHILCEIVEKSFSNRAVFLDRDGVINLHAPEVNYYVAEIEQFKILPGVLGAIRTLSESGFRVFVATNQRGVARKIVSWRQLQRLHTYLEHEVRAAGGRIDDFYVCAHDLSDGCLCRKPKPGLLLQAAAEHQVDLAHSWMIGDSVSDIEAGRAVGCRTALIGNGIGAVSIADLSGPTLAGIVAQLLNLDQIATN